MVWQYPTMLAGLGLLPLVAWLMVRAHRKRSAAKARFAEATMARRLVPRVGGARRAIQAAALLGALGCLIVAAARPRFGTAVEPSLRRGLDLVVLLDVSRSMTAEDVHPSRLERAKADVRRLVERCRGDRVGLVAFAGRAVVKVPLTVDRGFFLGVLDSVDTRSAYVGGTRIGDAIRRGLDLLPARRDRAAVMLSISDGEDHASRPEEAALRAAEGEVRIFTLGLGDARVGTPIRPQEDSSTEPYLKYRGEVVRSKMDSTLLERIAELTRAACISAGTEPYDLARLYDEHLGELLRGTVEVRHMQRYRDRFGLLLGLGVFLLLAEMVLELPGGAPLGNGPSGKATKKAVGLRALAIAAALPLLGGIAMAGPRDAARKANEGMVAFEAGRYSEAASAFEEAEKALPKELAITFNRAAALAAEGYSDQAAALYQRVAQSADPLLAARSHYNAGCMVAGRARLALGDRPEDSPREARAAGRKDLEQAIGHFRDCLAKNPDHAPARYNLELVRSWIARLEAIDDRDAPSESYTALLERTLAAQQRLARQSEDMVQQASAVAGKEPSAAKPSSSAAALPSGENSPEKPSGAESAAPQRDAMGQAAGAQEAVRRDAVSLAARAAEELKQAAGQERFPEGMRRSMQRALELGPHAQEAARSAAEHLRHRRPSNALLKQEEALRSLRAMAEPLARRSEATGAPGPTDPAPQTSSSASASAKQDGKSGLASQGETAGSSAPANAETRDLAQEDAEEAIADARQRQRQKQLIDQQLRRFYFRPEKVEKDW